MYILPYNAHILYENAADYVHSQTSKLLYRKILLFLPYYLPYIPFKLETTKLEFYF